VLDLGTQKYITNNANLRKLRLDPEINFLTSKIIRQWNDVPGPPFEFTTLFLIDITKLIYFFVLQIDFKNTVYAVQKQSRISCRIFRQYNPHPNNVFGVGFPVQRQLLCRLPAFTVSILGYPAESGVRISRGVAVPVLPAFRYHQGLFTPGRWLRYSHFAKTNYKYYQNK